MMKGSNRFEGNIPDFEPAYLALHRTGVLWQRAREAVSRLGSCTLCPRDCRADRLQNKTGVCKIGRYVLVSSCFPHFGEENGLRGWQGSGTIFFEMCNLRCVFCQNYDISHFKSGREVGPEQLAQMMIALQRRDCHNINLVTPEHVVPQILEALPYAVEMGLRLPLVYNTSAYDSLDSLKLLEGIVDIYMPDFKFWDPARAKRYLKARDYPEVAMSVFKEMQRQVGDLTFDKNGLAQRGLLVRHLVIPGCLDDTRQIMRFLVREISSHVYVNIMAQYHPAGRVSSQAYPEINRSITSEEYREAVRIAKAEGVYRLDEIAY